MSYLVRLINYSIINFFIQQAEDSRYCIDQFLKYAPYLLRYGKLYRLSGYFSKKASYGLVVAETPGHREDVYCRQHNVAAAICEAKPVL